LRMDEETYLQLLSLVVSLIWKEKYSDEERDTANERLTATLKFLANGRSY
jgi:hypothetical protein